MLYDFYIQIKSSRYFNYIERKRILSSKVDVEEVNKLLNDIQKASADTRASLNSVKEKIEQVEGMDSFSGKAAQESKRYFNDFHLTILESFRGLFDDLENNLQEHIQTFETNVDESDSAVISNDYLQDVKEDINELFEKLEKQDESIHDTIKEVSDISSATSPFFSDVNKWKEKSTKKLKELDEDLDSFTNENNEADVKAIINYIESAMNKAETSEGKARFVDFEGVSGNSELMKLKDFNEDKKIEEEEKIEKLDDSSKVYLQQAKDDYDNNDIDRATYEFIRSGIIQNGASFVENANNNKTSNSMPDKVAKAIDHWRTENRANKTQESEMNELHNQSNSEASATSRTIVIGPGSAKDVGASFNTSETVSRSELVDFLDEVKRAEKDKDVLNSIRFGIASSAVSAPLGASLGVSLGVGGGSGLISSLIIDKDLGSKQIQNTLNKSTAKKFNINIKYVKKSRGQDQWYEASDISITQAR